MAVQTGKFFPFGPVREPHQPHDSHWGDHTARCHDPGDGWRVRHGLWSLPALRKQAGCGAVRRGESWYF